MLMFSQLRFEPQHVHVRQKTHNLFNIEWNMLSTLPVEYAPETILPT